jgi:(5-formylfuran-3-yl)methyl phosphate synthase
MQLLVSVENAVEASAAIDGGADIVDAKDPRTGALGAVTLEALREIHAAVARRRPVTAAIGDASDEATVERTACAFAAAGARFVKVGFAGVASATRVAALAAAARRGVIAGADDRSALVLVAYADAETIASIAASALVAIAVAAGAGGVLLDTADKHGPGLRALVAPRALTAWVAQAHACGLFVAIAGKLTADDLPFVRDAGADVAGVRGAACEGGRTGPVSADRVRALRFSLRRSAKPSGERRSLG